jgi:chlorophyll/bacteriochlorophyll a synthase
VVEQSVTNLEPSRRPAARDVLELLKPLTWFPPIWAFACGLVSSGISIGDRLPFFFAGILLTGPLVCGTSQAVNDWFDRDVDAINEPGRPIPSGRIPGRWGLWIAGVGTVLSMVMAWVIGPWVFSATLLGLACAWAYSAPPFRLKADGWIGPGVVGLTYEGLSWFTGAAVMLGTLPPLLTIAILLLYSVGAHGIMTLNDFKAVTGDRVLGIRSLPARLGIVRAARIACAVMAVPQIAVVALLVAGGHSWSATIVLVVLVLQIMLMPRLLADPERNAPWYNATGTTLYVLGMMGAACGLGGLL